ncbi:MAG: hypothetical protein V1813_00480 [Candidatus Aenigmatarchaeota archaeon]
MNFERSIRDGYARKVPVDMIRARNLMQSAKDAVSTAHGIKPEERKLKTIMRELYEGLREFCEAIGYMRGYKFLSHESIAYFIDDVLHEPALAGRFDRYRKIRNGINYYGHSISPETVREAASEIPKMLELLEKHAHE